MPEYLVHCFMVVKTEKIAIEADDPIQACVKANKQAWKMMNNLEDTGDLEPLGLSFSEEVNCYLVDVAGDVEYEQSIYIMPNELPDNPNRR